MLLLVEISEKSTQIKIHQKALSTGRYGCVLHWL